MPHGFQLLTVMTSYEKLWKDMKSYEKLLIQLQPVMKRYDQL